MAQTSEIDKKDFEAWVDVFGTLLKWKKEKELKNKTCDRNKGEHETQMHHRQQGFKR